MLLPLLLLLLLLPDQPDQVHSGVCHKCEIPPQYVQKSLILRSLYLSHFMPLPNHVVRRPALCGVAWRGVASLVLGSRRLVGAFAAVICRKRKASELKMKRKKEAAS